MQLFSWNVNGLRSIYKKNFDEFLAMHKPDILCLQETKIDLDAALALPVPEGYRAFYSSAKKRGYSGVATLVKEGIEVKETEFVTALGKDHFDTEGRFLVTHHKNFTLYNIYFPSGTSGDERQNFKYDFLDHVLEHFNALPPKERDKLVICGDFNICHKPIDIHHPKTAEKRELSGFLPDERKWMDDFVKSGFVDCFRNIHGPDKQLFSWWTFRAGARGKNLGWRIDYFFTSKKLAKKISNADIHTKIMGSDHCPISIEFED